MSEQARFLVKRYPHTTYVNYGWDSITIIHRGCMRVSFNQKSVFVSLLLIMLRNQKNEDLENHKGEAYHKKGNGLSVKFHTLISQYIQRTMDFNCI